MTDELARSLRQYTSARVGLNRAGSSLSTREVLDFQLSHAQARDAVHAALDVPSLLGGLRERGLSARVLRSAAPDRDTYLRNPGLGRALNPESAANLVAASCDVVFVIADGLSALAVTRHALALLDEVLPLLDQQCSVGPVCIVEQGRVAIGDAIGVAVQAKVSVVLIGERPGLSSPDSLSAYITWGPRSGRTDAERNCISNIRPEGLHCAAAARVLVFYLHEALRQKLTGINLKLGGDFHRDESRGPLPAART
ncbi:MAG: ethanolamine ammonia-lyase subunit EutC [Terriglobales bacterium]